MKETTYDYVRVSTHDQNEARQLAAMQNFGVAEENIITERLSGKDFNRPLYQELVAKLQPGDVLVVKSIDRLGRDLTGTVIADIVLQLLSYVAQAERENIHQRQAEGIAAAKERGVKFGRKEKDRPENFDDTAQLWLDGYISAREGARRVGMNHCTFIKYAKQKSNEK